MNVSGKKVVYISGTRADYSLIRRSLLELDKRVDLTIIATCMHLSKKFGYTVEEIKGDGLKVVEADMPLEEDTLPAMIQSFGIGVCGLGVTIENISPDLIFVEGDRGESLAGAIVGAHLNIPVIHHGGGDVGGSIDNKIRYAISAFSDYHLAGNKGSFERLEKMDVPENRLFFVGEPGLDDIFERDYPSKENIWRKFNIDPAGNLILLIQHPNTEEYDDVDRQINETLSALKELQIQTIAIYSNADAGGQLINKNLEDFAEENDFMAVYPHVSRRDFLGLLNACDVMVGNSSAGIVELPSLNKPFICVGTRQRNRLKTKSTIEVDYSKQEIVSSIKKVLYDKKFTKSIISIENPYGDGASSKRIVRKIMDILEGIISG